MSSVKVSPKYQVVIPKEVREQVALRKGSRLLVVVKGGIITLIPDRPLKSLRGFARGVTLGEIREKKDRL